MEKDPSIREVSKFILTNLPDGNQIQILTTLHCLYVAKLISSCLLQIGIPSKIITECPNEGYLHIPYFVICPQMFASLPEKYVAFQMEQTINERWFNKDYFQILKNAFAIFDYSINNIRFLNNNGINPAKIYYLPIDYQKDFYTSVDHAEKEEYDVVFYGDPNNERRRAFLSEVSKKFRVRIVSEVFGDDLYKALRTAKVLVNIHYYDNALLETTRIYEALSLNTLIVSEKSSDMEDHKNLNGIVDFVEVNDVEGMIAHIQYWIDNEDQRIRNIENNRILLMNQTNMFEYYFYRFLLATENISFDQFWEIIGRKYKLESPRLCLHLPEYTDRTDSFLSINKDYGFTLFPGLRHSISWIGCGLSYKYMMKLAQKHQFPQLEICEDDVEFSKDFTDKLNAIKKYLDASMEKWDVFSGLLSDLSKDAIIYSVVNHGDYKIATTNKMIGAVYNIYNQNIYECYIKWNENDQNRITNPVDRYIEKVNGLKVVTTYPFLADHKKDLYSTIWAHKKKDERTHNQMAEEMIQNSTKLLKSKIDSFEFFNNVQKLDDYATSKEKSLLAGVVILYQPNLDEAVKNIASYISYIDHLYVVDNTPQPNEKKMKELLSNFSYSIDYIPNHKNLGLAKPLNIIAANATERGYKMLLTMDQDSKFDPKTAAKYFTYATTLSLLQPNAAIVALNYSSTLNNSHEADYHYHEAMRTNTSGSIFNLEIFNKIGGTDERLFLDEVDREYCLRAIKSGYKVFIFANLYLIHQLGVLRHVGYFGLFSKRYTELHSPQRLYFIKRNFMLLKENYETTFPDEFKHLNRAHKKKIKYQLLCSPDWYKSLYQVIRGYIDYKRKKFG